MKQTNFGNKKDNSNKKGTQREWKAKRREEAEARNAAFAALSLEEQIAKVSASPGDSAKQMAKLAVRKMREEAAALDAAKAAAEPKKSKAQKERGKAK